MSDSKAFCRQARARHRRQPRDRRGDRRSAGRGGRACDPRRPHGARARAGRRAHPRGRRQRHHRAARPHRGRIDRQARRRRRRALGKLDILVLNAAMLGSLTPVQDIDPKEYSRRADPQPARQSGDDRRLRPAAAPRRAGRCGRADFFGRRASRAPSGAPMARPRRRSRPCSAPMRTKPRIAAACGSISSIPARPARGCARSLSRAKSRTASSRPKWSRQRLRSG